MQAGCCCSDWRSLLPTDGVSAITLVTLIVFNQALAMRLLDRWERRATLVASREALAPLVRASIRTAIAIPLIVLVGYAGAGLLLYLAYREWSWWGIVALVFAFLWLRGTPSVLVHQAVAVIDRGRRGERGPAHAGD